ncbi:MAG: mechanosensitive ion channel family protein, partial [Bdellovibrionaceae bacterium]|nr:mechanosensitive ion channel family protein [Pseudobdellovibrionaceae bacterium]
TLEGFSGEIITLPNRFMAAAQISNFSPREQPIVRSVVFRIRYGVDLEKVFQLIENAAAEVAEVRGLPAPWAYVSDTNENWMSVKLTYFIDSYGQQFMVADKVTRKAVEVLSRHGIEIAPARLEIIKGAMETKDAQS